MATVMTSHRTGAAPPLPSRNNNSSRTVQQTQNPGQPYGRSHSSDVPPRVPPVNSNRRPSDPQGGVANSKGGVNRGGGGGRASERALPPLPNQSNAVANTTKPPPIVRKSFETKSFVKRHTASAYSDPSELPQSDEAPPPVPPPTRTLPTRAKGNERKLNDVYDVDDPYAQRQKIHPAAPSRQISDKPPDLPPSRPPKSSTASSTALDFEKRFVFHDARDFPDPEPLEYNKKTFPSLSASLRSNNQQASRTTNALGYL